MNSVSVQQLRLRILTFLIVVLFLSSFQAFLWLNGSRSESVFSWLSFDASMAIFQNDSARTALFDRLKASGNIVKTKRLGVASSITILSLPTRLDRRQDMDSLRLLLDIPKSEWKYMDAVASTDKRVLPVLEWVQYVRSTFVASAPKSRFSWPDEEEIDRLVQSDTVLGLWDTYPWLSPVEIESRSAGSGFPNANPPSVPCMIKDFTLPRNLDQSGHIPPHRILTPARVACWYSHLEAIQRIANSPVLQEQEAAIILEDDVDMESDIVEQLGLLWKSLPLHWDIVFLGHCWSNESYYTPLLPNHPYLFHNLYPSHRPHCTHAYVLSRPGARRIMTHLRHAPFAFSRAIDQALAWLVESGRIKAFSVVPSLVVQRKVRWSDISGRNGGKGSNWTEKLRKSILES